MAENQALDNGGAAENRSPARKSRRVDPVSLVAGLLFIAIALAALADRFWVDIDPVLVVGGTIVALGAAMIVGTVLRHRRRSKRQDG